MAKTTNKSNCGTSFHNVTIQASVEQLKKILGEPTYEDNTGEDKVNFEWVCELEKGLSDEVGQVFTIYDWKEYREIDETEIIKWHIGSMSNYIDILAYNEIQNVLMIR